MKKNIFKGLITGILYVIIIYSICKVTYYGMEYRLSALGYVEAILLGYLAIAGIIVFMVNKLKVVSIISKIAQITSIIIGIFVIIVSFANNVMNYTIIEYVMPGPTILLPNLIWLIFMIFLSLANIDLKNESNKNIYGFFIGSIILIVAVSFFYGSIDEFIRNIYPLGEKQNDIINIIIRVICNIGIIGCNIHSLVKRR